MLYQIIDEIMNYYGYTVKGIARETGLSVKTIQLIKARKTCNARSQTTHKLFYLYFYLQYSSTTYGTNLTQKISIDAILDDLINVQPSAYIHKKSGDYYRIPGGFSNNTRKVYKNFNLEKNLYQNSELNEREMRKR